MTPLRTTQTLSPTPSVVSFYGPDDVPAVAGGNGDRPKAAETRMRTIVSVMTLAEPLIRDGDLPEKVCAHLVEAGIDDRLAADAVDAIVDQETGSFPVREIPEIIDAAQWIRTNPQPTNPILEGLLDAGDKCALIGSSKMRKSFFALQLACRVASGADFLAWHCSRARRVLLVQLEVRANHYHLRVKRMVQALNANVEDRLHVLNGRGVKLDVPTIARCALRVNAEFVLCDPLYKLLDGDENSAHDVKPVLRAFDELAETTGAAIMYVHHDPKGAVSERNIRDRGAGSNVIGRDYDACITLTPHRDGEDAAVVGVLLRNHPPLDDFTVSWTRLGCFNVESDRPAVPARAAGRVNPTTSRPTAEYLPDLERIVSDRVLTKGELVQELRDRIGLTRDKAKALLEKAESEGVIDRWDKCYPKRVFFGTPDTILRHAEEHRNPNLSDKAKNKGGRNAR